MVRRGRKERGREASKIRKKRRQRIYIVAERQAGRWRKAERQTVAGE